MKQNIMLSLVFTALICIMVIGVYNHFDQPIDMNCETHSDSINAQTLDCAE